MTSDQADAAATGPATPMDPEKAAKKVYKQVLLHKSILGRKQREYTFCLACHVQHLDGELYHTQSQICGYVYKSISFT